MVLGQNFLYICAVILLLSKTNQWDSRLDKCEFLNFVNYEIVEMSDISGAEARIYSILPEGQTDTLFEQFVKDNSIAFPDEIKDITKKLYTIGKTTGARPSFFKDKEGKPGDLVCALYDNPKSNLRLYCIRFGYSVIILGGGGQKKKSTRAWQDDKKLKQEAEAMIKYAEDIHKRIKDEDLYWSEDRTELQGNLRNYDHD